ncbi:MAG: Mrp/NBP35 family ATP-binding protein [Kiritimatiellae bacterium]|nr:Mrp/NBP35 family ATP-binding protein [Kiritimatiellia bacterium]
MSESCSGSCSTCSSAGGCSHQHGPSEADLRLAERLSHIGKVILVMSGKGGVGKSTVAVNLAVAAAKTGKRVGLLDIDVHGPSVPTMLGLEGKQLFSTEAGIEPIEAEGVRVISVGFLLDNQDDPVVWRGPMKISVIRQFLEGVAWGDLDLLVIDAPPGTGDEPLTALQLVPRDMAGAVIVTTPQRVASVDVRKSVSFCKQLEIPVLGVIENMSGFVCPHCGKLTPILRQGGGKALAEDMDVPFLGSIPIDPAVTDAGDNGRPFAGDAENPSPVSSAFREIVSKIL